MKNLFSRYAYIVLAIYCYSIPVYADTNVLVIYNKSSDTHVHFYNELENKLGNTNIKLSGVELSSVDYNILNKYEIILPVGIKISENIAKFASNNIVLFSLIPEKSFQKIKHLNNCNNKKCYAVYINQNISRYVDAISQLPEKYNRVVLYRTPADKDNYKMLAQLFRSKKIKFEAITIHDISKISSNISKDLGSSDILLALPNPSIYNRSTAKIIILSTYHRNTPIVAYSNAFSRAGALLSVFSNIDDIASQTKLLLNKIINNKFINEEDFYPNNFSVHVNKSVARSLSIDIKPEDDIKKRISR